VSPQTYRPKHLAEKILISKAALEGERKQVTVLFADLKGSMELLADREPEEARKRLDPRRVGAARQPIEGGERRAPVTNRPARQTVVVAALSCALICLGLLAGGCSSALTPQ
jgi:hypothetical protein